MTILEYLGRRLDRERRALFEHPGLHFKQAVAGLRGEAVPHPVTVSARGLTVSLSEAYRLVNEYDRMYYLFHLIELRLSAMKLLYALTEPIDDDKRDTILNDLDITKRQIEAEVSAIGPAAERLMAELDDEIACLDGKPNTKSYPKMNRFDDALLRRHP